MARYVALLRGINVGGKNVIKMTDLRACFERDGFEDVATHIQSGNVAFTSKGRQADLTSRIERMLASAFDYDASVVLRSRSQMRNVVGQAPPRFGTNPRKYRYNVMFLRPPLTAASAITQIEAREGVDRLWPGPGVVYADRLESRATQSKVTKIFGKPIYQQITVRNWNTTTKLLDLLAN